MPKRKIIPYNPILKKFAKDLRNNSTKAEIILWNNLKGKVDGKYDFHRQKPIDQYIADFFCYELSLVIEIDGLSHDEAQRVKDLKKERRFNTLGLNVLRFYNSEVIQRLSDVMVQIKEYVDGFETNDLSAFNRPDTALNPLSGNVNVRPISKDTSL